VASVAAPRLDAARDTAAIQVFPRSSPQSAQTTNLVTHLRNTVLPPLERATGTTVYVGGATANQVDFAHVLSSKLPLFIGIVIALSAAAAAAIGGDNVGYLIGRKGGRWLLARPGPFAHHRARVLQVGEPFYARDGSKAVFLGRWILGLRTWASWLAGASHMPWRSFLLWNAAGGISWATTIGLVAYYAGQSATGSFALFGPAGLTSALGAPGVLLARQRRRRRHEVRGVRPGVAPVPKRTSKHRPGPARRAVCGRRPGERGSSSAGEIPAIERTRDCP
jgi:membrane-associated protein